MRYQKLERYLAVNGVTRVATANQNYESRVYRSGLQTAGVSYGNPNALSGRSSGKEHCDRFVY